MPMALCGYATRWNHVVHHHGNTVMALPGAFHRTLRSGTTVKLLLNHFDDQCVGSTDDNLELYSDQYGLAFRFRIAETEDGQYVRSMAGSNDCMSIGYRNAKTIVRKIGGLDVMCIVQTDLYEISFMHGLNAGLVTDAYATLMDTDYSNSLCEECSGGRFLHEGAAVGFKRSLQHLLNNTS
jgi:HK97 family phage prohead protease